MYGIKYNKMIYLYEGLKGLIETTSKVFNIANRLYFTTSLVYDSYFYTRAIHNFNSIYNKEFKDFSRKGRYDYFELDKKYNYQFTKDNEQKLESINNNNLKIENKQDIKEPIDNTLMLEM